MADDEAGEPAVRSLVDELIADLVIHVDGTKFSGEFERQEESITGRRNAAADGVVGIVKEKLGESRDGEARLSSVVETPLDAGIGLTHAEFSRGRGSLHAQPGIFVRELDAIANAKINIDVGRVGDRLIAIEERHVTEIDLPIERAGRAWIIGVIRRAALAECRGGGDEQAEERDQDPQLSY